MDIPTNGTARIPTTRPSTRQTISLASTVINMDTVETKILTAISTESVTDVLTFTTTAVMITIVVSIRASANYWRLMGTSTNPWISRIESTAVTFSRREVEQEREWHEMRTTEEGQITLRHSDGAILNNENDYLVEEFVSIPPSP